MLAVAYDGAGGVRVQDSPAPRLHDAGDAIVAVTCAGICGTDLHLLTHPDGMAPGNVLGHEFIGYVEEVGDAVVGLRPGDLVAGSDYVACGVCRWCRSGDHWHCPQRRFHGTGTTFGPELAGAQAEFVRVPFATAALRVLPTRWDRSDAVLLGDVLATGYAAVVRLHLRPGEMVAVIGGGPVGLLAAATAQLSGAGRVAVVEPVAARRQAARALGCHSFAPDAFVDGIRQLTDGRGADAVIDAVGGGTGLEAAVHGVRNAGRIISVGVPASPQWSMPVAECFAREIALGFAVGDFMRDAEALLDVLDSGLVVPPGLLDGPVSLEDAPTAYRAMQDRTTVKATLRPAV